MKTITISYDINETEAMIYFLRNQLPTYTGSEEKKKAFLLNLVDKYRKRDIRRCIRDEFKKNYEKAYSYVVFNTKKDERDAVQEAISKKIFLY